MVLLSVDLINLSSFSIVTRKQALIFVNICEVFKNLFQGKDLLPIIIDWTSLLYKQSLSFAMNQ